VIKRFAQILLLSAAALALTSTNASATSSRAEYVGQVNAICEAENAEIDRVSAEANRKWDRAFRRDPIKWIKGLQKANEWESDRHREIRAATLPQLHQVSPAPGDETLVADWLANRHLKQALDTRIDVLLEKTSGPKRHLGPKTRRNRKRQERELDRSLDQSLIALFVDVDLARDLGVLSCVRGAELVP
jgi:hypothetical protein